MKRKARNEEHTRKNRINKRNGFRCYVLELCKKETQATQCQAEFHNVHTGTLRRVKRLNHSFFSNYEHGVSEIEGPIIG